MSTIQSHQVLPTEAAGELQSEQMVHHISQNRKQLVEFMLTEQKNVTDTGKYDEPLECWGDSASLSYTLN